MNDEPPQNADPILRVRPVARHRLASRVASQLAELGEDVLVEVDAEASLRNDRIAGLGSDFLITSLDLRLRLALLVIGEVESPEDPRVHASSAQALLDLYPDTDAVVVVADNSDLSSVIVEPYDRRGTLLLPSGNRTSSTQGGNLEVAPVRAVISRYLRVLSPTWDAVTRLALIESENTTELAAAAAASAFADLKASSFRVPEKRAAQNLLTRADVDYAIELAMGVLRGDVDPVSNLQHWMEGR